MSTDNYSADALFSDDDIGFDKTEATAILDLREKFDSLSLPAKAYLGEALMRIDVRTLGFDNGDPAFESTERAIHDFKVTELDKAGEAAKATHSKCGLCENAFEEGDTILERQNVWVTPGSNQVQLREDLSERAHAACVKRVKEGGSAEAPLF
jgi:hypothetical protein